MPVNLFIPEFFYSPLIWIDPFPEKMEMVV